MLAGQPERDPVVAPYSTAILHFSELHLPPTSGSTAGGGRRMGMVGEVGKGGQVGMNEDGFRLLLGGKMLDAQSVVEFCQKSLAAMGAEAAAVGGGEFVDADRDRSGLIDFEEVAHLSQDPCTCGRSHSPAAVFLSRSLSLWLLLASFLSRPMRPSLLGYCTPMMMMTPYAQR